MEPLWNIDTDLSTYSPFIKTKVSVVDLYVIFVLQKE